jgi:pyridoxine kinase
VITPNQFELDQLSGRTTRTLADTLSAIDAVHALGPGVILVTSLHTDTTPDGSIDVLGSSRTGRYRVRTPKLPIAVNGAGDALAALFFAHVLRQGSVADALSRAVSAIFGVLGRTAEKGSREIQLIEAQQELVEPSRIFEAEAI